MVVEEAEEVVERKLAPIETMNRYVPDWWNRKYCDPEPVEPTEYETRLVSPRSKPRKPTYMKALPYFSKEQAEMVDGYIARMRKQLFGIEYRSLKELEADIEKCMTRLETDSSLFVEVMKEIQELRIYYLLFIPTYVFVTRVRDFYKKIYNTYVETKKVGLKKLDAITSILSPFEMYMCCDTHPFKVNLQPDAGGKSPAEQIEVMYSSRFDYELSSVYPLVDDGFLKKVLKILEFREYKQRETIQYKGDIEVLSFPCELLPFFKIEELLRVFLLDPYHCASYQYMPDCDEKSSDPRMFFWCQEKRDPHLGMDWRTWCLDTRGREFSGFLINEIKKRMGSKIVGRGYLQHMYGKHLHMSDVYFERFGQETWNMVRPRVANMYSVMVDNYIRNMFIVLHRHYMTNLVRFTLVKTRRFYLSHKYDEMNTICTYDTKFDEYKTSIYYNEDDKLAMELWHLDVWHPDIKYEKDCMPFFAKVFHVIENKGGEAFVRGLRALLERVQPFRNSSYLNNDLPVDEMFLPCREYELRKRERGKKRYEDEKRRQKLYKIRK